MKTWLDYERPHIVELKKSETIVLELKLFADEHFAWRSDEHDKLYALAERVESHVANLEEEIDDALRERDDADSERDRLDEDLAEASEALAGIQRGVRTLKEGLRAVQRELPA